MTSPQVSILVPVYNRENLLCECLESALRQTWLDFEVVVCDNASTDRTWQVCQEFAQRDSRIRIFRNETNVGPVRNWQRCFNEARGTFGSVLFSDDLLKPSFLAETLPWIQDPQVGFVFTQAEIGAEPGSGRIAYQCLPTSSAVPSEKFIHAAVRGREVAISPGHALFRMEDLRKSLVLDIPSPTFSNFAGHGAGIDRLLFLLTASRYPKIAFVAAPLAFFRSHQTSITVNLNKSRYSDYHHQANIWYAVQAGNSGLLKIAMARAWLSAMNTKRRFVSPIEIHKQYIVDGAPLVSMQALISPCLRIVTNTLIGRLHLPEKYALA